MSERTLQVNDGVGGAGFVQIPREQLGELTPQGFALHAALLSYGWRGSCWPGMEALAARTKMGEKALRAAKAELVEAGLLDETRRGQGKQNLYVVRTWEQRRAESRSSQTKVLDPPVGRHEVDVEEVEEDSLRSSSSRTAERPEKLRAANGVVALCDRLAELIRQRDPKAKVAPHSISWMTAAEQLMRIDERHFEEAIQVLEFSQRDPFWQNNILSMPTFRRQYGPLRAKWINTLQRNGSAPQKPQPTVAELMAAQEKFHADQRERLARRGITPDSGPRADDSRRETNARPAQGAKS